MVHPAAVLGGAVAGGLVLVAVAYIHHGRVRSASDEEETKHLWDYLYLLEDYRRRESAVVHTGVMCDECKSSPIRGTRYKCVNCPDYDLCEFCHASTQHNATHVFAVITVPVSTNKFSNKAGAPLLEPFYPVESLRAMDAETVNSLSQQLSKTTHWTVMEVGSLILQHRALSSTDEGIDFATFLGELGPTGRERNLLADRFFKFFNKSGSGNISVKEFVEAKSVLSCGSLSETIEMAFFIYDIDGDGFISREEMYRIYKAYFRVSMEVVSILSATMEDALLDRVGSADLSAPVSAAFGAAPSAPNARGSADSGGAVAGAGVGSGVAGASAVGAGVGSGGGGGGGAEDVDLAPVLEATGQGAVEELVEKVFVAMDRDGDGKISYEEFARWCEIDPTILDSVQVLGGVI